MTARIAIVLFNLGGPDSLGAVRPFLFNLFNDPAIIRLPGLLRRPLAWFISRRREKKAQGIYALMGGRSPILPNTEAQAKALVQAITDKHVDAHA
jgi:ferrochelatase